MFRQIKLGRSPFRALRWLWLVVALAPALVALAVVLHTTADAAPLSAVHSSASASPGSAAGEASGAAGASSASHHPVSGCTNLCLPDGELSSIDCLLLLAGLTLAIGLLVSPFPLTPRPGPGSVSPPSPRRADAPPLLLFLSVSRI